MMIRIARKKLNAAVCALAIFAQLQAEGLTGPSSGFIYDAPSQSIRPIIGFPGSAYLGKAVIKGLSYGSVSPDGRRAIVLIGSQLMLVQHLASAAPTTTALTTMTASPDFLSWSPDSTAAVWYSSAAAILVRASGLDSSPVLDDPIDVSTIGAPVASLAAGANATTIGIGVSGSAASGIYFVSHNTGAVPVLSLQQPSAIAFNAAGQDLYAADAATGNIYKLAAFSSSPNTSLLIPGNGAATDFTGLAIDRSGSFLYAPLTAEQSLLVYDLASSSLMTTLALDATPSSIQSVSGHTRFVLNIARGPFDPLLLLDGRGSATGAVTPGVYDVPAGSVQ